MKKMFVIANWMQDKALSGGDHIFIELVKRWQHKIEITLHVSREGLDICNREGLSTIPKLVWASDHMKKSGYLVDALYRTGVSIRKAISMDTASGDIVLSSSDFWPDFVPAFILKIKNPKIHWIAGFYLFAPKPLTKESPYRGKHFLTGLLYWLSQLFSYYFIRKFADTVFITSQPDMNRFVSSRMLPNQVIVIQGGVNLEPSKTYLNSGRVISPENRKYHACFVGRFHSQKGVLELIQIWKGVCKKIPNACLAMIGVGPLEQEVKDRVKQQNLRNNIDLLGFMVGDEKHDIFKQSRVVVHPAIYDSGGMAAAEAMAWGLPSVGFDLKSLKSYYPQGMLKTKCFDNREFANNIIELLSDHQHYQTISQEALLLTRERWDWNLRAQEIYAQVMDNIERQKNS